jgi:TnsA-like endonuclease N terminal
MTIVSEVKSITFPDEGQARYRKIVTRSRARVTGKYPSWKVGRMIQWESVNELNAFRLLDCDANVVRFNEQPCEIEYVLNGVRASHVPDILVEVDGRKELWEVKPECEALRPEVFDRTQFLIQHLAVWGYVYKVALGGELRKQPRLTNADRLLRFGRRPVTECEREFIRSVVTRGGGLVWSEACSGTYGAKGREILCRLALIGVLSLDMNSEWSGSTRFCLGKIGF